MNVNAATFSVSNGIVATVAIEHIDGPTPSGTYRILFLNSYTGATGSINPRLPEVTILSSDSTGPPFTSKQYSGGT